MPRALCSSHGRNSTSLGLKRDKRDGRSILNTTGGCLPPSSGGSSYCCPEATDHSLPCPPLLWGSGAVAPHIKKSKQAPVLSS